MGPVGHASVSTVVGGGVWAATGSLQAGVFTLAVGVLMDADHLYDYYQWYIKKRPEKIFVLLHAWEYSIAGLAVLAAVFYHPLFLAVVAAHLSHVITDHLHNHLSPLGYSIIYRIVKKFDASVIAPQHSPSEAYWHFLAVLPYGKRLAPWFQSRVDPSTVVPAQVPAPDWEVTSKFTPEPPRTLGPEPK